MEIGISTQALQEEAAGPRALEKLVAGTGLRRIELFANRPHLDYRDRQLQKEIASWFKGSAVAPPSLHLPFCERTGPKSFDWFSGLADEETERHRAIDEIKRALELADRLEIAWVVLHLGLPGQRFNPVLFERAFTLIGAIQSFAGVDILIENLPNEISTPARIREFLEVAKLPDVGICYDSGHGELQGGDPDLGHARALHLDDNDGRSDHHLWPFDGDIRWPRLVESIVTSGFDGPMILEVSDPRIERARGAVERIEALVDEARASMEEFRRRHGLARPAEER